ncbi:MAG: hypothetical protein DWQ10_09635 [Calditrichaeota bacterium]|nr:MAG: hypothetical protein DWQ10_09635 [Calditrichota bacterium]
MSLSFQKGAAFLCSVLLYFWYPVMLYSQQPAWEGPVPEIAPSLEKIAAKFNNYTVVLEPDNNAAEWWAGAPTVVRDNDGVFWMVCRMRSPEHPRGLRGYELRILRSTDGIAFEQIHRIHRQDIPIPGFERPAMLADPETGLLKLYFCGPWKSGSWSIMKFDDVADLRTIDPKTARVVIQAQEKRHARDVSVKEYKDPFIIHAQGKYHCFVTGYIRRNERLFHFVSEDGEKWSPAGDVNQPVMDLTGWHNFFIRPASVVPLGIGYLFVYEGSSTQWYDPVYNIGTGFGFTFDLHNITNLTIDSPVAISSTPGDFYTFRYSHWMLVDSELWVYAEVARPNNSHEIRLYRLELE